MFLSASVITLLCLVSVSQSVAPGCEDLVQPLSNVDREHLEGRWVMIAGSLKDKKAEDILKGRDSVVIDFHNSSYTQANRVGGECQYNPHEVTLEGTVFTFQENIVSFTGTFYNTSCADCMLLTLTVESPTHNASDVYLVSRGREVDQKVMEEFKSQLECLEMPLPVVMDPTKELCPEQSASKPEAQPKEV